MEKDVEHYYNLISSELESCLVRIDYVSYENGNGHKPFTRVSYDIIQKSENCDRNNNLLLLVFTTTLYVGTNSGATNSSSDSKDVEEGSAYNEDMPGYEESTNSYVNTIQPKTCSEIYYVPYIDYTYSGSNGMSYI